MVTKAGCVSAVFAVLIFATSAHADQVKCGDGTVKVKSVCTPNYSSICGTGTQLVAGQCVSSAQCPVCGNGVSESGELCDDGNTDAGDGCSSKCQFEGCGNGVLRASNAMMATPRQRRVLCIELPGVRRHLPLEHRTGTILRGRHNRPRGGVRPTRQRMRCELQFSHRVTWDRTVILAGRRLRQPARYNP
jgi:cysteine-rich repeat protein